MNNEFVLFYVKDDNLYPVMMSKDEHQMLKMLVKGILQSPIKILNEPQGKAINLIKKESEE